MSDGKDGNVVNFQLSQNGQDGEAGAQGGSKDQNVRKRKTPGEGFPDYENNSSGETDIRKSKSEKKKKKSSKEYKRSKMKRSSYSLTCSSSSSSTSSSGLESSSDDDEKRSKPKSKKHKISNLDEAMFQTEEEKHEYNLPKNLLKYADHYLKKFIPDNELKNRVLAEILVPKNFMKLPSLDVII